MGMLVDGIWVADDEARRRSADGGFVRPPSAFRSFVSADGSTGFQAEPGRYHLYAALSCPWAHRTLILRVLKGLEAVVSLSIVAPWTTGSGWSFAAYPGSTLDEVNHSDYLFQIYQKACANYTGRVTVPVLWDKHSGTIVSNESADIVRMFNSEFNDFAVNSAVDFYPEELRDEIDYYNEKIYRTVSHGVYKAGFSGSQSKYEGAVTDLFDSLDEIEKTLETRRYLCGDRLTEADWRLFPTLVRFDAVYYLHFKCNIRRLVDFPNITRYTRELYQVPGIADTVNFNHIKHHYYRSHVRINPSGIIPLGPNQDFRIPADLENVTFRG